MTNDVPHYALMATSGGVWDGIHNGGVAMVSPGDVLQFDFSCSGCDITAMDATAWSNVGITWFGWLDP